MEAWWTKERELKKKKLTAFFLTGFVLGVLYMILLGHVENSNMLMSSYFFSKYQYMEYAPIHLFGYILKSRISLLVFLFLMGLTVVGTMTVLLFGLWAGFSFGLILTMAVMKLGIAGILLCVMSMFPQYLIYFPAFLYGLLRIYEMSQQKKWNRAYLVSFGVTAVLVITGVLLESYVNPALLKLLLSRV
ncbi:MAG: hypothetical protein HFI31_01110 [Lachnospiraceae bacterium]|jgi:hypothetical protein|nr:hypothetical protein [Lachnospiraceae bacterium]MCI9132776.1 hypothetical protein [Lachnospiraceae bacterium]